MAAPARAARIASAAIAAGVTGTAPDVRPRAPPPVSAQVMIVRPINASPSFFPLDIAAYAQELPRNVPRRRRGEEQGSLADFFGRDAAAHRDVAEALGQRLLVGHPLALGAFVQQLAASLVLDRPRQDGVAAEVVRPDFA